MDTFESSGIAIADLALEVLAGRKFTNPGPRPNTASVNRVDWRQMRRWGLSESNLPANTIVLFKEPSFWEEHRTLVVATAGAFAVQSAFVAFLLIQMRRRRRAERSLLESERAHGVCRGLGQCRPVAERPCRGRHVGDWHCRAMFGIPPQQPHLEVVLRAVHPDHLACATVDARYYKVAASENRRVPRHPDERRSRLYVARGQARLDDHGDLAGVSGTFSDITARKSAEIEVDTQRQVLAHVTRVSTLGELREQSPTRSTSR